MTSPGSTPLASTLCVSAPGKTILMGEHAAVYGRPALVAAVDRRLEARLTGRPGDSVALRLPSLGVERSVSWTDIADHTHRARTLWETVAEAPSAEGFRRLRGDDPAHLVLVALGESAAWITAQTGHTFAPGLDLKIVSDLPVGAGFGSSAAVAVAIAQGLTTLAGLRPDPDTLHALTLDIERRQHGLPSGVDNGAVLHGGVIWAERGPDAVLQITPIELAEGALDGVRGFNTGEPAEPTGEVVAAVRERTARQPEASEALLDRMAKATRALRRLLTAEGFDAPAGPETADTEAAGQSAGFAQLVRDFEACLEQLGVVPTTLQQRIRAIEARGGAAKISGAGTLTGSGAGSLLVYHQSPETLDDLLADLPSLDARLGAAGARIER